jgi:cytochrome oxidase Cu insertion factor (SCO1/SenC/PrrC family)
MSKFLLIVTLLFSFATFIVLWMTQGEDKPEISQPIVSDTYGTRAELAAESARVEEEEATGEAAVGGAFTLTDQLGRVRTDMDFRGKVMIVFFGFTSCPDICPVTVATLSSLMELLGDKAAQVAPIFITVDPKRDTQEVMKAYLQNFDSRIVGLTGSSKAIKDTADAYKAYYSMRFKKKDDDDIDPMAEEVTPNSHAAHGAGDNYMMDHSGYIYIMNTEGNYVKHFPYNVSEQELADELKPFLK